MRDTTPEAARVHQVVLRRLAPERRLLAALALSDTVHRLALARLGERCPSHSRRQLVAEWLRRTLSADELPPILR